MPATTRTTGAHVGTENTRIRRIRGAPRGATRCTHARGHEEHTHNTRPRGHEEHARQAHTLGAKEAMCPTRVHGG